MRLGKASLEVTVSDGDGFRVRHGETGETLIHKPAYQIERADWNRLFDAMLNYGESK